MAKYLHLDSFLKRRDSDRSVFIWNLDIAARAETAGVNGFLDGITKIKVFKTSFPTIYANTVTMLIKELSTHSFKGMYGNYHFEFDLINDPRRVGITAKPIIPEVIFPKTNLLDTITLEFRNPDQHIQFPPDILYDAEVKIIDNEVVVYYPNHGLQDGELIFLEYFGNIQPYELNKLTGHLVESSLENEFKIGINIIMPNTEIGVAYIKVASRRIRINLELQ